MLVFGHYDYKPQPRDRFDRKYIVFNEEYKTLNDNELKDMFSTNEEQFNPDNSTFENFAQAFYNRKIGADFFKEMNRSIEKAWYEWTKKSLT
jgi:DnaJ-class molecular chaperone